MWFKKEKKIDIATLEKRHLRAESAYKMYEKTLMWQMSFSERQRDKLIELKKELDETKFDLDKARFENVVKGVEDETK